MKKFLFAFLLGLGMLLPGMSSAAEPASSPYLTPTQAQQKISQDTTLFLLDVRSEKEYAERHLPGAVLIPLPTLSERMAELPTDRPILIYCRSGKRASAAYDKLHAARPDQQIFVIRGYPIY